MKNEEQYTKSQFQRVLIAAFNGWSDAGTAATTAVEHLIQASKSDVLHVIACDGYVDLQMFRPVTKINENGDREIEWPDSLLFGSTAGSESDSETTLVKAIAEEPAPQLFLLQGTEPAFNWLEYVDEIMELIESWSIDLVLVIGSMFSDAPHSRPIPVTMTSETQAVRYLFEAEKPDYEGPIGISSVLITSLVEAGIPSLSVWAQVPHYVHSAPSPKATLAILDKIEEIINIVIPRGDLLESATQWEQNIDNLASADEEMKNYIEKLEEARDTSQGPKATGDAIAYEVEKFLRKRMSLDDPRDKNTGNETNNDEN